MNKNAEETSAVYIPLDPIAEGNGIYVTFKDEYDMSCFIAAMIVEKCSVDDLVSIYELPTDTFVNTSMMAGYPKKMSLQEIKDKGFHLFVFKPDTSEQDVICCSQALTYLFYPEFNAENKEVKPWLCKDLKLFFVPPSKENDACVENISSVFGEAMQNVMAVFDVKEQNGLVYLQPKKRLPSWKNTLAFIGLKVVGFDLDHSWNVLPSGQLMAMNKRDEALLLIMHDLFKKPYQKSLLLAKEQENARQNGI